MPFSTCSTGLKSGSLREPHTMVSKTNMETCVECHVSIASRLTANSLKLSDNSAFREMTDLRLACFFNKRRLRSYFGRDEVCDVDDWIESGCPELPNKLCWKYDIFTKRRGVLDPFNYCDVVRLRTRKSGLRRLPIQAIPLEFVVGLLVRKGDSKLCLTHQKA